MSNGLDQARDVAGDVGRADAAFLHENGGGISQICHCIHPVAVLLARGVGGLGLLGERVQVTLVHSLDDLGEVGERLGHRVLTGEKADDAVKEAAGVAALLDAVLPGADVLLQVDDLRNHLDK